MKKVILYVVVCTALFVHTKSNAQFNTKYGSGALQSLVSGTGNSAFGAFALSNNTNGNFNTGTGAYALTSNQVGNNNTAVGYEALFWNTIGQNNTSVGMFSSLNTTGNDNSVFGYQALFLNKTGTSNCAFGLASMYNDSTGYGNTAFGYKTMQKNKTGTYNTVIGLAADLSLSNLTNATALGHSALATASNQVRIGNNVVQSIGGFQNWSNVSDGRVKKNIKQNVPGLALINKLTPVTYNLDPDAIDEILGVQPVKDETGKTVRPSQEEIGARKAISQVTYSGFIAQDVEKAAKQIGYDFSGVDAAKNSRDLYGLRYGDFVVPLVKAVQELSKMNDQKDSIINNLESRLSKIETMLNVSSSNMNSNIQKTSLSSASLQQNIPNPFNNTTTINYSLPKTYSTAKIIVVDKYGKILKEANVSGTNGSLKIDASTLSSGAYNYSLFVDGKLIDTKQMLKAN